MDLVSGADQPDDYSTERFAETAQDLHFEGLDELRANANDVPDIQSHGVWKSAKRRKAIPLTLVAFDQDGFLALVKSPENSVYGSAKRATDIIGATLLGLACLPFLPIVAAAIKLDSAGPVIYRQTRLGKDNSPFEIFKFRTMVEDAEAAGAAYASENDSRVTRVGRFLRSSRLDEIPQLWNVLKGEMSFIGPRPERPENIALLEAAIPCFSARTRVRPGLTGWAQIKLQYAATVDETSRKVEYDFYYLMSYGPLLDLKIALRTVETILKRRGR